jgi:hypothetical protein
MKELIELEKQVTEETRELLVSLDEKQKKLIEFQTNIVNIHGHSCSLQYKLNFSWCSLQCSLISNTYDGNFWYSIMGIVV